MKKGTPRPGTTRALIAEIAERNAVFKANHAAALEAGEKKYVGRLCQYNHDDGSGASVRYASTKSCVACDLAAYASPEGKAKRRAASDAWFHANREKHREIARARYETQKNDPDDKQRRNEIALAWYEAHKDDPELKAKRSAAAKRWRDAHKDDPEYKAKQAAKAREHYEFIKANPEYVEQRRIHAREKYALEIEQRRQAGRERYARIRAEKLAAAQQVPE
jgi:hypothetical protein